MIPGSLSFLKVQWRGFLFLMSRIGTSGAVLAARSSNKFKTGIFYSKRAFTVALANTLTQCATLRMQLATTYFTLKYLK